MATVNKVTNANIYINGANLLGKAEEVDLPEVTSVMAEHKALGMVGQTEFFAGIEKMEARIKWSSFYADVMKKFNNPTQSVQIQVRSSINVNSSAGLVAEQPVVVFLTATPNSFPMGKFKQHDNVELETKFTVTYAKLRINGEDIYEIDVLANIYKIGGVDILANYRANLGI